MYSLPTPGSDSTLIGRAPIWRDIVSMIAEWKQGKFYSRRKQNRRGTVYIKNDCGRDVEPGELLQVSSIVATPDSSLGIATNYSPILIASEPTWHTEIDNLVIADGPVLEDEFFPYSPRPYGVVSCTDSGGRFVMPDPDNPQYGKTADAGMFRVLGYDTSTDFAIVDRGLSQHLWRYELTEASKTPSDTAAKLLTLSGDVFADEIDLTDPDGLMADQTTGDKGWCVQAGNKFYAQQAVCS